MWEHLASWRGNQTEEGNLFGVQDKQLLPFKPSAQTGTISPQTITLHWPSRCSCPGKIWPLTQKQEHTMTAGRHYAHIQIQGWMWAPVHANKQSMHMQWQSHFHPGRQLQRIYSLITNPCSQHVKAPLGKILSPKLPPDGQAISVLTIPNNHTVLKYSMPLGWLCEWLNVTIAVRCFAESVGFKGTQ